MAELKERAIAIINDDTEFNNLPFEERKRICKTNYNKYEWTEG